MSQVKCFCGGEAYAVCCEPLHLGHTLAPTAVALMRARYAAFAIQHHAFLSETWHPSTRPERIDLSQDSTEWSGLEIVRVEGGSAEDHTGMVEFTAHFRYDGQTGHFREVSQFVREDGRWLYLHGQILPEHSAAKPGRNALCPCGSGKKFKRCCGT